MGKTPKSSKLYFREGSGRFTNRTNSFSPISSGFSQPSNKDTMADSPSKNSSEYSKTRVSSIDTDPLEVICCVHGRSCIIGKTEKKEAARKEKMTRKYEEDQARKKKMKTKTKTRVRCRSVSKSESKSKNKSKAKRKSKSSKKERRLGGYENLVDRVDGTRSISNLDTLDDGQYENLDPSQCRLPPPPSKSASKVSRKIRDSKASRKIRDSKTSRKNGDSKVSRKRRASSKASRNSGTSSKASKASRTSKARSKAESLINVYKAHGDADDFDITEFYIGVRSEKDAKKKCRQRTSFRLYHWFEPVSRLNDMPPKLHLYIVYRTSTGLFCHFPVIATEGGEYRNLYVDYGDPLAPRFSTIQAMVRYYTVYVQLHYNENGNVDPDVFPWWNLKPSESQ